MASVESSPSSYYIFIIIIDGLLLTSCCTQGVNSLAPTAFQYLVTYVESHSSEGSFQASVYYKITASLWILTAMLTAFVTPFVESLDGADDALIPAMYAIFITELLKTPITQILDPVGHFYRHCLAPRAPDQERMMMYFVGTEYQLSERYTVRFDAAIVITSSLSLRDL